MSGRRLRKFLLLVVIGSAVAKVIGLVRARSGPDPSRHPAFDGGVRPPPPSSDPYQAPMVEPAAVSPELEPLAPLEDHLAETSSDAPPAIADRDDGPGSDPAGAGPDWTDRADQAPARDTEAEAELTWVEPVEGLCPDGYPVKAKVRSGIYHRPGVTAYGRTTPDRCYPSAEAAEADGLRPAKR